MAHTVRFGGDVFPLSEQPPALGEIVAVPGAGVRVLYVAPSLERWPAAAAKDFAETVRRSGAAPRLLVCSADHPPIAEAWAAHAGWDALRFDRTMLDRLGLWLPTLSLPAKALLIADASGRLRYWQVAALLEDEVSFDAALAAVRTIA